MLERAPIPIDTGRFARVVINGTEYEPGSPEAQAALAANEAMFQSVIEEASLREAVMERIRPLTAEECVAAILAASPSLTALVPDALAWRMSPYLPEYDASATYTVGTAVVRDGKVERYRGRLLGWSDLGEAQPQALGSVPGYAELARSGALSAE